MGCCHRSQDVVSVARGRCGRYRVRSLPTARSTRGRRHGGSPPRLRHRHRAHGGGEGAVGGVRAGQGVPSALPARSPAGGPAARTAYRADPRFRRDRGPPVPGDASGRGPQPGHCAHGQGDARPRRSGRGDHSDRGRPGRRAHRRRAASGCETVQYSGHAGGLRVSDRFRDRPQRSGHHAHPGRHDDRDAGLYGAGTTHAGPDGRALGCVLPGLRAVRMPGGDETVSRGQCGAADRRASHRSAATALGRGSAARVRRGDRPGNGEETGRTVQLGG